MNSFKHVVALTALLVCSAHVVASGDVDRSLDAAPDGRVEINNVSGAIHVRGTDDDVVHLRAELGRGVEDVIFERDGDVITIRVEVPSGTRNVGRTDLEISVPRASELAIDAVSAHIVVSEVNGRLAIRSVSGDIELATASRDLEVSTMSGDVEMRGQDQTAVASLSSVSGDVVLSAFAGDVRSQSVSGDVDALLGEVSRIHAESTSGSVRVNAALRPDARVDLETVSGDVELGLTSGRAGHYTLETFSGDVESCFGPEPERRRYAMGTSLKFTEGDGGPTIRMNSMSGSVRLCD